MSSQLHKSHEHQQVMNGLWRHESISSSYEIAVQKGMGRNANQVLNGRESVVEGSLARAGSLHALS